MRKIITIIVLIAISFCFLGCQRQKLNKQQVAIIKEKDPIQIGVILPLTGEMARAGQDARRGIALARENFESGNYEIRFEDSLGTKEGTIAAMQKLIDQGIKILIGEIKSGNTLSIVPIAEQNKVLLLVPISAASEINEAGDYIFKFREDNNIHAEYMANFAFNKGFGQITILYENTNDVWVGVQEYFKQKFASLGGQITSIESYTNQDNDFRTQLTKIKTIKPDAIYLAGHPAQVGLILKQAKEIGLNTQCLGNATLVTPELIDLAGKSAEDLIVGAQNFDCDSSKSELVIDYCMKYKQTYQDEPLYYGAYIYDTISILLNILEQIDQENIEMIKNKLYEVKNYQGLTGNITLDDQGNVKEKDLLLKIVKDGQFVPYK